MNYLTVFGKTFTFATSLTLNVALRGCNLCAFHAHYARTRLYNSCGKKTSGHCIASLKGYKELFLSGPWPDTITLHAVKGKNTIVITVI